MFDTFGYGKRPGALYKNWPKAEDGTPVPPKLLTHCQSTDMADVMLANMLEAYGIPVLLQPPGDGAFGKVILGISGTGNSIYVPEPLYEDAKQLMEEKEDDELQSGV